MLINFLDVRKLKKRKKTSVIKLLNKNINKYLNILETCISSRRGCEQILRLTYNQTLNANFFANR